MTPTKPKKVKLSALVAKADRITSTYIRQKYADPAGYVSCITCSGIHHWQAVHCAHYVERGSFGTRYVEENLHPACVGCNAFRKEFHKRQYTLFMIDTYGREKINELILMSHKLLSPSEKRAIVEEAIEYYQNAFKDLQS